TLIAVTKTVPVDRIRIAAESGIRHTGENRLQEALPKIEDLRDLGLIWHFIGRIQTNKAKKIAENFAWIHSIDRTDVADKLGTSASKPISVLVEVKLHEEPNKSGAAVADIPAVINAIRRHDNLKLKGLMAVPPFLDNPEEVRPYFRKLRELGEQYQLPELSMGMTNDFEVAIEEGATMVRIGTGLFGKRQ
ncbi:MAG TPA: YggS family pyridoxal phosphate-dependent enzyme, partial [Terriglobia bacterium]|nr:YggS family pyridoxal phosphate-dependent enzyme [Terriglobia bacterium]